MFCKNCGNELRDGSRFCDKCGVPVAQAENRDVLSSATKQRGRKKLLLIIAAVSACIVAAVVLGAISGKKEPVKFEDFLVERCVREALGKNWDEDISADEAASIRELTISWEKDATIGLDVLQFRWTYIGYVNLSDLQYLTGLKSLELDFFGAGSDVFEHLDAITNCKNLQKLTMPLVLGRYNYNNGYTGKGYRYLADIFSELPLLKEVDFGVSIPAELQKLLLSSSANKEIVFAGDESFYPYGTSAVASSKVYVSREGNHGLDSADEIIGPTELSADMEDAVIYVDRGEIFDCSILAACTELKTLVVFSDVKKPKNSEDLIQVVNLDSLAQLPCLSSVSFLCASIDLEDLEEISGLKELYLTFCDIRNVSKLQTLTSLCELSIISKGITEEDSVGALSGIWESLPNLHYFHGYLPGMEPEDMDRAFGNINSAKKLETLALHLRNLHDFNVGCLDGEILKTLFLDVMETSPVDFENVEFNKSFENLILLGSIIPKDLQEFIAVQPNLTAVTVGAGMFWSDKPGDDAVEINYNNIINAAIQNENVSMLDLGMVRYELNKAIQWKELYEHRIYDQYIQLGAFMRDMDVETYMQEQGILEK